MPVLRRRLACADHALRHAAGDRAERLGDGARLAGRRRRPGARDDLPAVQGTGARRTASAAVDDHAAGLAGTGADLQGPAGKALGKRPVDVRFPRLPAAAGRRHPDLSCEPGAGRRGPGAAHRVHARDRAPFQPHLRPGSRLRGQGRGCDQASRRQAGVALSRPAFEVPPAGRRPGARISGRCSRKSRT